MKIQEYSASMMDSTALNGTSQLLQPHGLFYLSAHIIDLDYFSQVGEVGSSKAIKVLMGSGNQIGFFFNVLH